jgi:hypothetical protein
VGQQSSTFLRDRRERPRVALRAPVLVDLTSRWEQAVCHDVSLDGVGVELTDPLPLGARVEIYFELPTWHAIETQAEVVRNHAGSRACASSTSTPRRRAPSQPTATTWSAPKSRPRW